MDDGAIKKDTQVSSYKAYAVDFDNFVLEKNIFSKVFEKDIKRAYIYKKSERLAKAVHMVCPAFAKHPALKDKIDAIAVGLIEAAILPPSLAREALSKELLALSSILAIAGAGGALSQMNSEIIAKEAHALLEEVALYDEPKISLASMPTFSSFLKRAEQAEQTERPAIQYVSLYPDRAQGAASPDKGQIKDKSGRKASILSLLKSKGPLYIKDISSVVRDVGEKTIQRELQALVRDGVVRKEGDKRWTRYSLPS